LLNHVSGPESVVALVDALDKAPVRRDVLRMPPLRENREIQVWHNQAADGVPLPSVPELGYVWAPWARALDEAIPGLKPVSEALDQAVEQIRSYIEPQ
jgi:maltose-binding protein MalE